MKITLFGEPGSGTSTTGKKLAKKLNYDFISSGDIFRNIAKINGFDLYTFSKLCETNLNFDRQLDLKIKQIGKLRNNFVLDSRLGWYFIPDSIKIKLFCDFNIRIERISKRDNEDLVSIKNKTLIREKSEKLRYFNLYKLDNYTCDCNFDFILNSTNLNVEQICEKIIDFINVFKKVN